MEFRCRFHDGNRWGIFGGSGRRPVRMIKWVRRETCELFGMRSLLGDFWELLHYLPASESSKPSSRLDKNSRFASLLRDIRDTCYWSSRFLRFCASGQRDWTRVRLGIFAVAVRGLVFQETPYSNTGGSWGVVQSVDHLCNTYQSLS